MGTDHDFHECIIIPYYISDDMYVPHYIYIIYTHIVLKYYIYIHNIYVFIPHYLHIPYV